MADDAKRIAVVVGDDLREVTVRPGTTCADVLAELGVGSDYWLAKRDGQPFGADENVWACADGDKLVAIPPVDVSATLRRVSLHRNDWTGAYATRARVIVARLRSYSTVVLKCGLRCWLRVSHKTPAGVLPEERRKAVTRSPYSFDKRSDEDLQRRTHAVRRTPTKTVATKCKKARKSGAVTRNTRPFELERNWNAGNDGVLSGYYKTRGSAISKVRSTRHTTRRSFISATGPGTSRGVNMASAFRNVSGEEAGITSIIHPRRQVLQVASSP